MTVREQWIGRAGPGAPDGAGAVSFPGASGVVRTRLRPLSALRPT